MSKTVNNPPALIAQETPCWCFAAAEQMARAYYQLPALSQYAIARDSVVRLAAAMDPQIFEPWFLAVATDESAPTPPSHDEQGGANVLNSSRVQVVRSKYGVINMQAIGAHIEPAYTQQDFRTDIDNQKIVIIGTTLHFLVVYGYDDTSGFDLLVRDPSTYAPRASIPYEDFIRFPARVILSFR